MSEAQQPPDEVAPEAPAEEESRLELPGWVPAAIGLVLVALAAMAVYTGFYTRVRPVERTTEVEPFDAESLFPEETGGAPGSPGPGDSRVRPGGEAPTPGVTATGEPGLAIEGDASGVTGRVRLAVRRGLVFDVEPSDTIIFVNDVAVGTARQFSTADEAYEFAEEGVFTVRLVASGYDELEFVVSAGHEADKEVEEISTHLQPSR